MNVDLGVYSKNSKDLPRVIGPRRRIDRRALTSKAIEDKGKKKKKSLKRLMFFGLIILVFVAIGGAVWKFNSYQSRVSFSDNNSGTQVCDNILNPQCWRDSFKPTVKKTDNYTNILMVGIDTRATEPGLQNTDTIIVASINHETKKAMLISIPRDMLVNVKIDGQSCCTMKINGIYSLAVARNDVDDGMVLLQENLEELLDIDIHYTAMVNFQAVKDAVEAVGGVEITVEDTIPVLYPQDEPPYDYDIYTFKPGVQTMDGQNALVWARFRQVYSNDSRALKYASDFSRADRQQQVIDALKEKVLSDESNTTDKAQKYWKLYQSMSDNIKVSGISFEDILAGFSLVNDFDPNPVNIVLDPNFGGINSLIYTPEQGGFGYHIMPRDNTWGEIRKELDRVWQNPTIYDDEAIVLIANQTGEEFSSVSKAAELEKLELPFAGLYTISQAAGERKGITIIDFSNGKKQRTIDYLKEYFGVVNIISDPESQGIKQSGYNEDIKIEIALE